MERIELLAREIKDNFDVSKRDAVKYAKKLDILSYEGIQKLNPLIIRILENHGYYSSKSKHGIYTSV